MTDDTDDDTDEMTEKAMTLVRGAAHESRVSWLPESQKLQDAIGDALHAYWDYLDSKESSPTVASC